MTDDKTSPEERLLKAVDEGFRKKEDAGKDGEMGPPENRGPGPAGRLLKGLFSGFRNASETFQKRVRGLREKGPAAFIPSRFAGWRLDLRFVNRFLTGSVIVLVIAIGVDFAFFRPEAEIRLISNGTGSPAAGAGAPTESLKDLNHYLQAADSRNIFRPYVPKPPAPAQQEASAKAAQAAAGPTNFKIVALASTGSGFEAIIEDTTKSETFFVKEGDSLNKEYKIVSIAWDRVTVSKGRKKWDLR